MVEFNEGGEWKQRKLSPEFLRPTSKRPRRRKRHQQRHDDDAQSEDEDNDDEGDSGDDAVEEGGRSKSSNGFFTLHLEGGHFECEVASSGQPGDGRRLVEDSDHV